VAIDHRPEARTPHPTYVFLPVGDLFSNAMSQEQGNIENVNRLSPSSFEALFPLGYNGFRTKVMKGVPS
jgi:hypothetical protein